ncbi:hypothetical protein KY361_05720 [Candidatus Woesearchaeota archaeon]|nr:hypothetical protein [Candidatus Woesearchaeota archaeon]
MNKKLITWILALLLLVPTVLSVGITPGRTTIDFVPNDHREFSFRVINNEYKDINVLLLIEGELKDSITLEEKVVKFTSQEYSKSFAFEVDLPEDIGEPGIHEARIIAVALPEGEEGLTSVQAAAAVATQLRVKVPYPGKYLEARLEVVSQDDKTLFFVAASNLGTETINRAKATIEVFDPDNQKVATIETTERSIESKQRVDLVGSTQALKPGAYRAVMHLTYDEYSLTQEKRFEIEGILLDVLEVFVKDFKLGEIAKFNILVESKWNELIKNAYAQLIMKNNEGDIIADTKSASFDISPSERKTVFAYWDTEDVEEGAYDGKVILHYEDRTTEKTLRTYVNLEGIDIEIIGVTAAAVKLRPRAIDTQTILTLLVIILILINIGWFVYFKRRQR